MEDVVLISRQRGESSKGTERETLDAQLRVIEAYARRKRLLIVDLIAITGISAHELFLRMVTYLSQHPSVKAIVTYSADRLFRGLGDNALFDDLAEQRGITLYVASGEAIVTPDRRNGSSASMQSMRTSHCDQKERCRPQKSE